MFSLDGERDRVIAQGKKLICISLQQLHDCLTNARTHVLRVAYKHIYKKELELEKWEDPKTRYEKAVNFHPAELTEKFKKVLTSKAPFGPKVLHDPDDGGLSLLQQLFASGGGLEGQDRTATAEVLNLTLYSEPDLVSEALRLLSRQHSQRRELNQQFKETTLVVDDGEEETSMRFHAAKVTFQRLALNPDKVSWTFKDPRGEGSGRETPFNDFDTLRLHDAYANWRERGSAASRVYLREKRTHRGQKLRKIVDFEYPYKEVQKRVQRAGGKLPALDEGADDGRGGGKGNTVYALLNQKDEETPTLASLVYRVAATDKLIEILNDPKTGLTPLCFHRLDSIVHPETGRIFKSRNAMEEYAKDNKDDREYFIPNTDDLEQPNQDMLLREEWHTEVLRLLQKSIKEVLNSEQTVQNARKRFFFYSCFEFLYFFCWDNRMNKRALSEQTTLDFLFGLIEPLQSICVDIRGESVGETQTVRMHTVVVKLLQEILHHNSLANDLLMVSKHVAPVVRGLFATASRHVEELEGETSPSREPITQLGQAAMQAGGILLAPMQAAADASGLSAVVSGAASGVAAMGRTLARGGTGELKSSSFKDNAGGDGADEDAEWKNGRAGFVLLLKALVEDEVKPLPARQDEVVRELRKLTEDQGDVAHVVLPLYKRDDGGYDVDAVFGMYVKDYTEALEGRWAPPPDGLPDPEADDSDLAYHLELLDLIGMCAKGSNKVTEDYARSKFGVPDIMRALTEQPPPEAWGRAQPNPLKLQESVPRRLPVLIRSPFVRLLHGVAFSMDSSSDGQDGSGQEMSKYAEVFDDWHRLTLIFRGLKDDIATLVELIRLEEEEEARSDSSVDDYEEEMDSDDMQEEESEARTSPRRGASPGGAEEDDVPSEEKWKTDEASTYEYRITVEEHVFFVLLPFVVDFLSINRPLTRNASDGSSAQQQAKQQQAKDEDEVEALDEPAALDTDGDALVQELRALCKELLNLAQKEKALQEVERYRIATASCLTALSKREITPKQRGGAKVLLLDDELAGQVRVVVPKLQVGGAAAEGLPVLDEETGELQVQDSPQMAKLLEGEDYAPAIKLIVLKQYVTKYAHAPFLEALGDAFWTQLEYRDLLVHKRHKEKRAHNMERVRDYEHFLLEQVEDNRPHLSPRQAQSDDGKAKLAGWGRVHLFKTATAEFNELVDLYNEQLKRAVVEEFGNDGDAFGLDDANEDGLAMIDVSGAVDMSWLAATELEAQIELGAVRQLSGGRGYARLHDEEATSHAEGIDSEMGQLMRQPEARLRRLLRDAPPDAQTNKLNTVLAFLSFSQHGATYFRNMFAFLVERAHGTKEDHELCEFLLTLLSTLLTTNVQELQRRRQGSDSIQQKFEEERQVVSVVQRTLDQLGGVDTLVRVIANVGPDYALATVRSREIVKGMLGVSTKLLLYGNAAIQDSVLAVCRKMTATAVGANRAHGLLPTLRSMVRRNMPHVRKMREVCTQTGLQAWQQRFVFNRLSEEVAEQSLQLSFVQLLCEGHNRQLQNFLRVQGSSTTTINVDLLGQLVEYTVELADAITVSIVDAFIKDDVFAVDFVSRYTRGTQLGKEQKLLGWHMLKREEIVLLVQQMRLMTQALSTLTELVQGPCLPNQLAIVRSSLLERFPPLLEIASCMNLTGSTPDGSSQKGDKKKGDKKKLPWIGSEVLQMNAAFHAAVNNARKMADDDQLFKDTAGELARFISNFPDKAISSMVGERLGPQGSFAGDMRESLKNAERQKWMEDYLKEAYELVRDLARPRLPPPLRSAPVDLPPPPPSRPRIAPGGADGRDGEGGGQAAARRARGPVRHGGVAPGARLDRLQPLAHQPLAARAAARRAAAGRHARRLRPLAPAHLARAPRALARARDVRDGQGERRPAADGALARRREGEGQQAAQGRPAQGAAARGHRGGDLLRLPLLLTRDAALREQQPGRRPRLGGWRARLGHRARGDAHRAARVGGERGQDRQGHVPACRDRGRRPPAGRVLPEADEDRELLVSGRDPEQDGGPHVQGEPRQRGGEAARLFDPAGGAHLDGQPPGEPRGAARQGLRAGHRAAHARRVPGALGDAHGGLPQLDVVEGLARRRLLDRVEHLPRLHRRVPARGPARAHARGRRRSLLRPAEQRALRHALPVVAGVLPGAAAGRARDAHVHLARDARRRAHRARQDARQPGQHHLALPGRAAVRPARGALLPAPAPALLLLLLARLVVLPRLRLDLADLVLLLLPGVRVPPRRHHHAQPDDAVHPAGAWLPPTVPNNPGARSAHLARGSQRASHTPLPPPVAAAVDHAQLVKADLLGRLLLHHHRRLRHARLLHRRVPRPLQSRRPHGRALAPRLRGDAPRLRDARGAPADSSTAGSGRGSWKPPPPPTPALSRPPTLRPRCASCQAPSFDDDLFASPEGRAPVAGFLFSFLYNFFVISVMPAIVSGIIIDTFSEMRAESDKIKDDMENVCFVCNIKRDGARASRVSPATPRPELPPSGLSSTAPFLAPSHLRARRAQTLRRSASTSPSTAPTSTTPSSTSSSTSTCSRRTRTTSPGRSTTCTRASSRSSSPSSRSRKRSASRASHSSRSATCPRCTRASTTSRAGCATRATPTSSRTPPSSPSTSDSRG